MVSPSNNRGNNLVDEERDYGPEGQDEGGVHPVGNSLVGGGTQ